MINKKENIPAPSQFLPIFQQAEKELKKAIVLFFLLGKSRKLMQQKITAILTVVDKKVPKDVLNRSAYIDGLKRSANIYYNDYFIKPTNKFENTMKVVKNNLPNEFVVNIKTPQDLISSLANPKNVDIWAEAKGSVRISNYQKEIKQWLNGLSKDQLTTSEQGKKPITLWQKAELDIRHQHQMDMLDDLKGKGVKLAYISSHPDCSKRCEKWQGHLVSLTETTGNSVNEQSPMSDFFLYKVDGKSVYSLTDIMSVKDKYGHTNNIINGFNCRHHLIEYHKGEERPTDYDAKDVAKQRNIETRIRQMERSIRKDKVDLTTLETQLSTETLKRNIDKLKAQISSLKTTIKQKTAQYKAFCEKNGYAWEEYRIK